MDNSLQYSYPRNDVAYRVDAIKSLENIMATYTNIIEKNNALKIEFAKIANETLRFHNEGKEIDLKYRNDLMKIELKHVEIMKALDDYSKLISLAMTTGNNETLRMFLEHYNIFAKENI